MLASLESKNSFVLCYIYAQSAALFVTGPCEQVLQSHNKISEVGADAITDCLKSNSKLKTLYYCYTITYQMM